MHKFYELMYGGSVFLTTAEEAECGRLVPRLGVTLMQLRELSRQKHFLAVNIIPKRHYFQHLVSLSLSQVINRRMVQTYKE